MNPEFDPNRFNPDAAIAALIGTWKFAITDPLGICLLHFTNTGRAIQFFIVPQQPEKPLPMRLWYSVESGAHLRFRPRPDHAGWLRGYAFSGDTMILSAEDNSWVCTRPTKDEIPDWFAASVSPN